MYDWHQLHRDDTDKPAVVDPRRRVRICLAIFAFLLLILFARTVQLELSYGAAYRAEALKPIEKERTIPGIRGKILARDGTILACDKEFSCVAVQYRYLQNPPDATWLKSAARSRLSKTDRSKPARVAEEQNRLQAESRETARRLAKLCGISDEEWNARAARIQTRVERIAAKTNALQERKAENEVDSDKDDFSSLLARSLQKPQSPEKITVAEELDYHVMCDDPPPAALAEIEKRPKDFPEVKIVKLSRRFYPQGKTASNVLGYLGREAADEWIGKQGVEKSCETILRGRPGTAVDKYQRGGRLIGTSYRQKSANGQDLTLALDLELQKSAEELLDSALERRQLSHPEISSAGGAIVVMEIADGSLRTLATAPRFDPNAFVADRPAEIAALLADPSHPLFDRASRMAIPPGSVFKIVTSIALLESGCVDPEEPFFCQGYLERPEAKRCAIFVDQGIGHGETTLSDALCRSCNVYFFHHSARMGVDPLLDWAERLGFGHATGVDLPSESAGVVPNPENIERLEHHPWKTADTQALSVGQGSLTATPLQIARLLSAVAANGILTQPHLGTTSLARHESRGLGLRENTMRTLHDGLERVVSDPAGTAHGSVYLEEIPIAGKTGTAETSDNPSHAWFAGYVPADKPKYAFVIALEHVGEAAATAGPVVKRLVLRMKQLGMFDQ